VLARQEERQYEPASVLLERIEQQLRKGPQQNLWATAVR